LKAVTHAGSIGLVLAGNAREPHEPGPPVVAESEIRQELGDVFQIVWLREFRFDQVEEGGGPFLAWSCFLRRLSDARVFHDEKACSWKPLKTVIC
jgi:hypothetical protein